MILTLSRTFLQPIFGNPFFFQLTFLGTPQLTFFRRPVKGKTVLLNVLAATNRPLIYIPSRVGPHLEGRDKYALAAIDPDTGREESVIYENAVF